MLTEKALFFEKTMPFSLFVGFVMELKLSYSSIIFAKFRLLRGIFKRNVYV
jgi:hypothetical protein